MSLSAKLGMLEFMTRCYTRRPPETSSKLPFWRLRQARGDEPVRRLNQELKLPRLSKPTEKQISVTGNSVRSRRNLQGFMELDPNRRNGYRAIRVKFKVTLTRVHVLARPRLPDSES